MCDCITKMNEKLTEFNTQLNTAFSFKYGEMGVRIETFKRDPVKRGKAIAVIASYCPFCSEKYDPGTAGGHR